MTSKDQHDKGYNDVPRDWDTTDIRRRPVFGWKPCLYIDAENNNLQKAQIFFL